MDRRLYMRQWLLAMDRFELRLRSNAGKQRNAFLGQAAKDYENTGNVSNHIRVWHEAQLGDVLFGHLSAVIPYFGRLTTKQIKSKYRVLERKANDTFFIGLMEWAKTRALNNASSIADTDMGDVRAAIESGLAEGLGNEDIARNLRRLTNSTPYRAATIARTETHAAATYGAIEEAHQTSDEIGIKLVKSWLPTTDERTRPAHAAMANAPSIGLDEQFEVDGEYLDRPGDPAGSAENVINCRCAILTEEAPQ